MIKKYPTFDTFCTWYAQSNNMNSATLTHFALELLSVQYLELRAEIRKYNKWVRIVRIIAPAITSINY